MSQTYIGVIVMILSEILPKLGLTLQTEALTTTVSTVGLLLGALWAFWGRHRLGGLTKMGLRK